MRFGQLWNISFKENWSQVSIANNDKSLNGIYSVYYTLKIYQIPHIKATYFKDGWGLNPI